MRFFKGRFGQCCGGCKAARTVRFCGGEAETAQTEYTHETFIGLMSPITKGEKQGRSAP